MCRARLLGTDDCVSCVGDTRIVFGEQSRYCGTVSREQSQLRVMKVSSSLSMLRFCDAISGTNALSPPISVEKIINCRRFRLKCPVESPLSSDTVALRCPEADMRRDQNPKEEDQGRRKGTGRSGRKKWKRGHKSVALANVLRTPGVTPGPDVGCVASRCIRLEEYTQ
eukprot:3933430-Rhodomonas_salina.7